MPTEHVYARFPHLITTTQQLPNARQELFAIDEQKLFDEFFLRWYDNVYRILTVH